MKKTFSAKSVYGKYSKFYLSTLRKNPMLIRVLAYCLGLAAIFYLVRIGIQSPRSVEGVRYGSEFILTLQVLSVIVLLMFVFSFAASYLVWLQRFTLDAGKIIDEFPRQKSFVLKDIEKIVLMNPRLAHIYIKPGDGYLYNVCYWHGLSKEDWQAFLSLMIAEEPDVASKIYVNDNKWAQPELILSSFEESYEDLARVQKHEKFSAGAEENVAHGRKMFRSIFVCLGMMIALNSAFRFFKDFGSGNALNPIFYFVSVVGLLLCFGLFVHLKKGKK